MKHLFSIKMLQPRDASVDAAYNESHDGLLTDFYTYALRYTYIKCNILHGLFYMF